MRADPTIQEKVKQEAIPALNQHESPVVGKGSKKFVPLKPTVRVRRSFIHQPKFLKKLFLVVVLIILLSLISIFFTGLTEKYNDYRKFNKIERKGQ